MRIGTWLLALVGSLATSLALADPPPSATAQRDTHREAPAHHRQSAIGRALAGLLEQASSSPPASTAAAATDAPRVPVTATSQADDAPHATRDGQAELAVH